MQCTYTPSLAPAPPEYYDGAINTVGIDVGVSAGSVLAWGVFAPTSGLSQGALAGEYVGASGDVGRRRRQCAHGRLRPYRRFTAGVAARLARIQCRAGRLVTEVASGNVEVIRCAFFSS